MSHINPRALEAAHARLQGNCWITDGELAEVISAMLEAVTPILQAEAWDRGRLDAQTAPPNKLPTNPYQDQVPAS